MYPFDVRCPHMAHVLLLAASSFQSVSRATVSGGATVPRIIMVAPADVPGADRSETLRSELKALQADYSRLQRSIELQDKHISTLQARLQTANTEPNSEPLLQVAAVAAAQAVGWAAADAAAQLFGGVQNEVFPLISRVVVAAVTAALLVAASSTPAKPKDSVLLNDQQPWHNGGRPPDRSADARREARLAARREAQLAPAHSDATAENVLPAEQVAHAERHTHTSGGRARGAVPWQQRSRGSHLQ